MQPQSHICPDCSPRPVWKFRLLYLSSDLEVLITLRAILTSLQVEIIACFDRESAILFLKSEIPYDLLLIDLEWRGADAFKLARLVRSLRHRKQMTTLLMSATTLTDQMDQLARKAGIHESVAKTHDLTETVGTIMRSLEIMGKELEINA
jgi:PleD family two-component response regulator